MLYACDAAWWKRERDWRAFAGKKASRDPEAARRFPEITLVESVRSDELQPAPAIGWGGNSGFQTLNLAVNWGCRRIVLVGFDMRLDLGLHWHGPHAYGLNNPMQRNVDRWRRVIDGAAPALAARGVTVVNASPVSALAAYPIMSLEEALACRP